MKFSYFSFVTKFFYGTKDGRFCEFMVYLSLHVKSLCIRCCGGISQNYPVSEEIKKALLQSQNFIIYFIYFYWLEFSNGLYAFNSH